MQQTLHLQIIFTMTITIHSLVIASPLTEQFLDVLDALRLLLVLTHHAQGGREELLAVLQLLVKICTANSAMAFLFVYSVSLFHAHT
jgi:hypothetical protein